ncbi:MAG: hypothetical protein HYX75_22290 [Acidobacteria bacterium]|nr:hypothetical protein [Acidobacteriota bacterium]
MNGDMSVTVESVSAMQQAMTAQRVAIAAMRQVIAHDKATGQALVELIDAAGAATGGGHVDLTV